MTEHNVFLLDIEESLMDFAINPGQQLDWVVQCDFD